MYRIQTLNKIAPAGLDLFPRDRFEIASEIPAPDAMLVRSASLHDLALPPTLKAIGRAGAGVNNIPVDRCSEQGIVVFNTPGANANGVKEMVLAGLLLSSRRVYDGITWARSLAGKGSEVPALVEKEKSAFAGPEIKGKKLGVVGLGAIGVMVANDALALGMDVCGYDPYISVEAAWGLSRSVRRALSLDQLLAEADYITLHLPLLDATRNLVNADMLNAVQPGTQLLNFAREGIVDDDAAVAALREERLGAYLTDFPSPKLQGVEGVIATPHLGASTVESEENCAVMASRQLMDFLENGNIVNSVNFPTLVLERAGGHRLALTNRNVPRMLGHVLSVLSDRDINVIDMLNKSRENLAYNLLDLEVEPSADTLQALQDIEGVINVRMVPEAHD